MKKTVSATEARVRFGELLRAVAEEGATYVVERSGKPQAVVISAAEYENLIEDRSPDPSWWIKIQESRALFQAEFKGDALTDPIALINGGRQERDDAILGDLLRRQPHSTPDNGS